MIFFRKNIDDKTNFIPHKLPFSENNGEMEQ